MTSVAPDGAANYTFMLARLPSGFQSKVSMVAMDRLARPQDGGPPKHREPFTLE
jgi:hypothetical protein